MSETSAPDDKATSAPRTPCKLEGGDSAPETDDVGVHVHDFDREKEHRTLKPTTSDPEATGWGLGRKGPACALNNDGYDHAAWHIAGGMPERQAWRLAGFSSNTAAGYIQKRMAEHPNFVARVEELREAFNKRGGISMEHVLDRLAALATSDIADCIEPDPGGGWRVKDLTKLPPAARCRGGVYAEKLWDVTSHHRLTTTVATR